MSPFQFGYVVLLAAFCMLLPPQLEASHVMGGNLTWTCTGPNLRLELAVYRNCSLASVVSSGLSFVSLSSTCNDPTLVVGWGPMTITEVTPACPGTLTQCASPSSTVRGVEEHLANATYSLPSNSQNCDFEFAWSNCCRNANIVSGAANQGLGVQDVIHHPQPSCQDNRAPVYTNPPLFYACAGQPYVVHQGAYDPDGDSLAYRLKACYTDAYVPVHYNAGFSPSQPLGPSWIVQLDSTQGYLYLDPNSGNPLTVVFCMVMEEYRAGVLLATYTRDIQLAMITCPYNSNPSISTIQNASANTTVHGDTITVCALSPFSFQVGASDPQTWQTVRLYWDHSPPGAVFEHAFNPSITDTVSGSGTGPMAKFSWTPTTPGIYHVMFTAEDDQCTFFGTTDRFIVIEVKGGIYGTIDDHNSQPLQAQKVYLIRLDTMPLTLTAVDSAWTSSNGYYEFCQLPAGSLFVKAAPDSATYPGDMPTYALGNLYWNGASTFLHSGAPYQADFHCIAGANPGGPGFISGLVSQGANKRQGIGDPVTGLRMFLYNVPLGHVVATDVTDSAGYFSFPNIPIVYSADYRVTCDFPYVDTLNSPTLSLWPPHAQRDSVRFLLHTTYLELDMSVGLQQGVPSQVNLHVAREGDQVVFMISNLETQEVALDLYDLSGRLVYRLHAGGIAQGEMRIRRPCPASGLYLVRLKAGDLETVRKFRF